MAGSIMRSVSLKFKFVILAVLLVSQTLHAQDPASLMVKLTGKIYSEADSSLVMGQLLFEKLPYYDDMGIAVSGPDGEFETYLLKGNTYILHGSAYGFQTVEINFEVGNNVGEDGLTQNFYLPIREDLKIIVLENLIFDTGKAGIRSTSFDELDKLAIWILSRPKMVIQLEGHTDPQGNPSANLKLSQDRVDAVKDYLIKKGVNRNQVLTKAFGGSMPITSDKAQLAKNRRVEVRIIQN